MAAKKKDFTSIRISRFFMRAVGFWTFESKTEERLLNCIVVYTYCAIILALWIESAEIYFSIGDFYAITYTACTTMPVITILIKLCCFVMNRKEILKMLRYTQNNFWYAQYDEYGSKILQDIDKRGTILICTFTFFVQSTVVAYVLSPIFENIGKNESDRILPFNIWLGVPVNVSPNFEIAFVLEVLALVHSGLCFCCFDNFLGLLNMHTAGQFKLLQHRLETTFEKIEQAGITKSLDATKERTVHEELRKCLATHYELIWYSKKMESIFMYTILGQLLVSSVMLCVAGFQVFLGKGILIRRLIFIAHTNGCFCQLFVLTLTANELLDESRAVGDAAYNANWQILSHRDNRGVRNAILMIIIRSARACSISAGGFFPVSLETFMTVLSTAASYFTLLRNFILDENK